MDERIVHRLRPDVGPGGVVRIAVAGAGGTGSKLITRLVELDRLMAARGCGRLHVELYDPDVISEANIGRTAFYAAEVGVNKAVALIQRANIGFGLRWRAFPESYVDQACVWMTALGPMTIAYDVLVTAVDSGAARLAISRAYPDTPGPSRLPVEESMSPFGRSTDRSEIVNRAKVPRYWLDCGNSKSGGQVVLGEFAATRPAAEEIAGARKTLDPRPDNPIRAIIAGEDGIKIVDEHVNYIGADGLGPGLALMAHANWDQPKLRTVVEMFPGSFEADAIKEDERLPSCSLSEAEEQQEMFVNDHVVVWAATLLKNLLVHKETAVAGYIFNLDAGRVGPIGLPASPAANTPSSGMARKPKTSPRELVGAGA